jgi:hypothetical protein
MGIETTLTVGFSGFCAYKAMLHDKVKTENARILTEIDLKPMPKRNIVLINWLQNAETRIV